MDNEMRNNAQSIFLDFCNEMQLSPDKYFLEFVENGENQFVRKNCSIQLCLKTITDESVLTNTIYHEMIHARNHERTKEDVIENLSNPKITIGGLGYIILNEFDAYSEAEKRFPDKNKRIYTFDEIEGSMIGLYKKPWPDKKCQTYIFYEAVMDIIMNYILGGKDSLPVNSGNAIEFLEQNNRDFGDISWHDFEKIGNGFIEHLIEGHSWEEKKNFRTNIGIDSLETSTQKKIF